MLTFFALLISLLAAQSQAEKVFYALEDADRHFEEFITTFSKQYSNKVEKNFRFNIFKENLKNINEDNAHKQATYGVTQFSDLTAEEFSGQFTGPRDYGFCEPATLSDLDNVTTPDSFDWRDFDVVNPVRHQGSCKSAWAFSVAGNVEGLAAMKHRGLVKGSVQQLVDCVKTNYGCNFGLHYNAFEFLSKFGGMMLENDYPYYGKEAVCEADKKKIRLPVRGCNKYEDITEKRLKQLLINVGPLSIAIDSTEVQNYAGGIMECTKVKPYTQYAALLVGFGIENEKKPYWIVQNSLGTDWGEKGYFRLSMENNCQLLHNVFSAVIP